MSAQPCGCDTDVVPAWVCAEHTKAGFTYHSTRPAERVPETVHVFTSGATRNADTAKFDYEAFLNPEALHAYGEFMHAHRLQKDGTMRNGDNWQKGIPFRAYVKSLVRHTIDLWRMERGYAAINPDTDQPHTKQELCCAIVFNAMGYLKELVDPSTENTPLSRNLVVSLGPRRSDRTIDPSTENTPV